MNTTDATLSTSKPETSSATIDSTISNTTPESPQTKPVAVAAGPLNLEQIRRMRLTQATEQNGNSRNKKSNNPPRTTNPTQTQKSEASNSNASEDHSSEDRQESPRSNVETAELVTSQQSTSTDAASTSSTSSDDNPNTTKPEPRGNRKKFRSSAEEDDSYTASAPVVLAKVARPNIRQPLSSDLENELESALIDADLNGLMIGDRNLQVGRNLEQGTRHSARIIKIHQENVFLSLGGPDEGVVPLLQFNDMPKEGDLVDCLIRGFNNDDGLYDLALPGEASSVDDWNDIQEGLVVEATIESANTGGLECKVGGIRGFIPMRQISEYRVEETASYIGQRLLCVILEANPRRGNLVLSHRAILERDKAAKKTERLASLTVGDICDGTVRKVADFGAFVDIGGLDGLIHISQLSWDRITHPSEIVKEGDQIQVRVEKIDPQTGKIGLSYRATQDHPWDNVETLFPVGSVVKGIVSRIANFGAFVKLAIGVEGLVHVSELAHRRIASVNSVVEEGQEVEAKVLSVDREAQRMSLSLKAIQAKPESESAKSSGSETAVDEPQRVPVVAKHRGPLKGGTTTGGAGERFGLKW